LHQSEKLSRSRATSSEFSQCVFKSCGCKLITSFLRQRLSSVVVTERHCCWKAEVKKVWMSVTLWDFLDEIESMLNDVLLTLVEIYLWLW